MKTITTIMLTVLLAIGVQNAKAQNTGKLVVRVENARNNDGNLMITVLDPEKKNPPSSMSAQSDSTGVTFTFENLAPGKKQIMLFHDENGNQKLDRGQYGIPSEGYGTLPEAGTMDYSTKIEITENQTTEITLHVRYIKFNF